MMNSDENRNSLKKTQNDDENFINAVVNALIPYVSHRANILCMLLMY